MTIEEPEDPSIRVVNQVKEMVEDGGVVQVYNSLQNPTIRSQLNIPQAVWVELESELKSKVLEAKKRAREKLKQQDAKSNSTPPSKDNSIPS